MYSQAVNKLHTIFNIIVLQFVQNCTKFASHQVLQEKRREIKGKIFCPNKDINQVMLRNTNYHIVDKRFSMNKFNLAIRRCYSF